MEQYLEKNTISQKGKISKFATGNEKNQYTCIYYFERHELERCDRFIKKTSKKRNPLLPKQKSCYECLKAMNKGNNLKTCTQWLVCCRCKGNHPAPFHGYTPNKKSKAYENQAADGWGNLKNNFASFNDDLKFETCGWQRYDKKPLCNVR